ncbi:substrate-binding domain-containing protein [Pleurocapsales cyanobacterium LEGE 10410]|nr:substrate-binding domain-containing protein [Pleurocapsales cyanobacterium LEGE 10410]
MNNKFRINKAVISTGIILVSFALAYAPLPGIKQTIIIVSGTELKEPLEELETRFERDNKNIDLELKFQGSQDLVNNYIDQENDFQATILIPANGQILEQLAARWKAQNNSELFYNQPQAIAKTILVGIAWQERGKILFPDDKFSWSKLERAMKLKNWSKIGGKADWGSFDFVITNPTRSNSGQLTLNLWLQSEGKDLNSPDTESLVALVKNSVYQPPRSTDILLQEFITRGANDGDVAMVYESIALHRWSQAKTTQGQPYQIYYPATTIETIATAAIVRPNTDRNTAKVADKFIEFLVQPQQQAVFVQYGFRPVTKDLDWRSLPNSPWAQNIPGIVPNLNIQQSPSSPEIAEIQRLWNRVQ